MCSHGCCSPCPSGTLQELALPVFLFSSSLSGVAARPDESSKTLKCLVCKLGTWVNTSSVLSPHYPLRLLSHLAHLSVLASVPSHSLPWTGLLRAAFPALRRLSYVPPSLPPCWRSQDSDGGASACRIGPPGMRSGYFAWMDCLYDHSFLHTRQVPAKAQRAFSGRFCARCALCALRFSSRSRTVIGVGISLPRSNESDSAFWVLTLFFLSIDFHHRCCCCFLFSSSVVFFPLPWACVALACVVDCLGAIGLRHPSTNRDGTYSIFITMVLFVESAMPISPVTAT